MPIRTPKDDREMTLMLPELHHGQQHVLNVAKQYNFLAAGRGWRKTTMLIALMVEYAMNRQEVVVWTCFTWAPIWSMISEELMRVFGDDWENVYDVTNKMLRPPGWAPVFFGSLEEWKNLRGKTPGLVICDEFGELEDGIFTSLLAPYIWKSDGVFWGAGTPNPANPENDLYLYSHEDATVADPDIVGHVIPAYGGKVLNGTELIRVPHPLENPDFSWARLLKSWRLNKTAMHRIKWRIEVLVEFLQNAGSQIHRPERVCTVPYEEGDLPDEFFMRGYRPSKYGSYQKGADLARGSEAGDALAIGVIDLETNKQVYMRFFVPEGIDGMTDREKDESKWEQLCKAIARCDELFPGTFYADITGMGLAVPNMVAKSPYNVTLEGINYGGSSAKKVELYDAMASYVENHMIELFEHPDMIKQMKALKRTQFATRIEIKGAKGVHDDLPAMVALMCKDIEGGVKEDEPKPEERDVPAIWRPGVQDRDLWNPDTMRGTSGRNPFATVGKIW